MSLELWSNRKSNSEIKGDLGLDPGSLFCSAAELSDVSCWQLADVEGIDVACLF